jgi:hypothetical protein
VLENKLSSQFIKMEKVKEQIKRDKKKGNNEEQENEIMEQ